MNPETQVMRLEDSAQSETSATLQVLLHAARDPNVKPENLEKFLAMHRELLADQRKEQFNAAMSRLQPRLPRIKKGGKIEIVDKITGQVKQSTPFARYEDIDRAIRPLLQEEGFSISFNTEERTGGGLIVHARLAHAAGHSETSSMPLPIDTSGSKNNIQGMGSALSYGKRYLVCAMLNIVAEGEDNDGNHENLGPIEEREVNLLLDMIKLAADPVVAESKFAAYMKVKSISDIRQCDYPKAYNFLRDKIRAKAARDAEAAQQPTDGPPANLADLKRWPEDPRDEWYRVGGRVYHRKPDSVDYEEWKA